MYCLFVRRGVKSLIRLVIRVVASSAFGRDSCVRVFWIGEVIGSIVGVPLAFFV